MIKYLIGAVSGGAVGYFVFYRLIGCSTGGCPLTANPYVSTVLGVVLGLLIVNAFFPVQKSGDAARPAGEAFKKITAEEAKARIDSGDAVVILDVRTEAEYAEEHIPGAILIPNETIADTMPEQLPDLGAEILVYCRSGSRSAQAARKLAQIGYTNVSDFGGIFNWPYEKTRK